MAIMEAWRWRYSGQAFVEYSIRKGYEGLSPSNNDTTYALSIFILRIVSFAWRTLKCSLSLS